MTHVINMTHVFTNLKNNDLYTMRTFKKIYKQLNLEIKIQKLINKNIEKGIYQTLA